MSEEKEKKASQHDLTGNKVEEVDRIEEESASVKLTCLEFQIRFSAEKEKSIKEMELKKKQEFIAKRMKATTIPKPGNFERALKAFFSYLS